MDWVIAMIARHRMIGGKKCVEWEQLNFLPPWAILFNLIYLSRDA